MPTITPPLKCHGGKHYLAAKIVALMPPHLHHVEPFAGGLNVLLARPEYAVSEVANDIDGHLMNFWAVLGDPGRFEAFRRRAEATPFSEAGWRAAHAALEAGGADPDPVGRAWAFVVACRQSLAGRGKAFTSVTRRRVRRGMNAEASAWLTAVDGLPAVHDRLNRGGCRHDEVHAHAGGGPGGHLGGVADTPVGPPAGLVSAGGEVRRLPDVRRGPGTRPEGRPGAVGEGGSAGERRHAVGLDVKRRRRGGRIPAASCVGRAATRTTGAMP